MVTTVNQQLTISPAAASRLIIHECGRKAACEWVSLCVVWARAAGGRAGRVSLEIHFERAPPYFFLPPRTHPAASNSEARAVAFIYFASLCCGCDPRVYLGKTQGTPAAGEKLTPRAAVGSAAQRRFESRLLLLIAITLANSRRRADRLSE